MPTETESFSSLEFKRGLIVLDATGAVSPEGTHVFLPYSKKSDSSFGQGCDGDLQDTSILEDKQPISGGLGGHMTTE